MGDISQSIFTLEGLLVAGCWLLAVGCWFMVVGCSLLVVSNLFVVCCLLFAVCLLFACVFVDCCLVILDRHVNESCYRIMLFALIANLLSYWGQALQPDVAQNMLVAV